MTSPSNYLGIVTASIPPEYASDLQKLTSSEANAHLLENVVRFIAGAEATADASPQTRKEWVEKQNATKGALLELMGYGESKRTREDDGADSTSNKRAKLNGEAEDDAEPKLFTLHSISTTSPIRKKVDITIHKNAIKFYNASTHAFETSVPVSSLTRAFILPTRGKQKPHWTVVLLSSDSSERGSGKPAAASSSSQPNYQIIFGIDAVASTPFTTTSHASHSSQQIETVKKGAETLPSLRAFLSHLPAHALPVLEPSTDVFRSACAGANAGGRLPGSDGVPGVEAYRAAKPGTLWFFREGVLWGESKPCEFWAVEDLAGKGEGVRLVSATGRTCTVILKRKGGEQEGDAYEEEDDGIETEFGMVDGKEQDGISQWVRKHQRLFGQKKVMEKINGSGGGGANANAQAPAEDDTDPDDESFGIDSDDSDGGSATSDSSSEEEDEAGGEGEGEGDAEESGDESGAEEDGDEELTAERHPLLRPGAMPRMSRAAIDMVVELVEDDLMGGGEVEEDELED